MLLVGLAHGRRARPRARRAAARRAPRDVPGRRARPRGVGRVGRPARAGESVPLAAARRRRRCRAARGWSSPTPAGTWTVAAASWSSPPWRPRSRRRSWWPARGRVGGCPPTGPTGSAPRPPARAPPDRRARPRRARRRGARLRARSRAAADRARAASTCCSPRPRCSSPAAATILVARVLPPAAARAVRRSPPAAAGLVPVVATARASRTAGTRVPLLTLTVAVALVVFCGTTAVTVSAARTRPPTSSSARTSGSTGPSTGRSSTPCARARRDGRRRCRRLGERTFGRRSGVKARLVLVDAAELAAILAAHGRPVDPGLAALGRRTGDGGPGARHPALRHGGRSTQPASWATRFVDLRRRRHGRAPAGPAGDAPSARGRRGRRGRRPRDVRGGAPGRALATTDLGRRPGCRGRRARRGPRRLGRGHGHGARRVADDWRASPLNAGLLALLVATGLALAGLRGVALVLTVVATCRERGRTLSALRTLGLDARTARRSRSASSPRWRSRRCWRARRSASRCPWLLTGALGLDLLTGAAGGARSWSRGSRSRGGGRGAGRARRRGGRGVGGAAAGPAGRGAPGGRTMT